MTLWGAIDRLQERLAILEKAVEILGLELGSPERQKAPLVAGPGECLTNSEETLCENECCYGAGV